MSLTVYFICTAILQLTSAQVLSYVQRNPVPQALETTARYITNVANSLNNAVTPSSALTVARVPTAAPVANPVATNANANIANINAVNAIANQNYAGQNLANNYASYANVASQNAVNAVASAASQNAANAVASAASQNAVNALAANANYANAYANQNVAYAANALPAAVASAANALPAAFASAAMPVANANLNNAALASATLTSIDGNMATFNLGTNGNTFTITSGSPGTPGFGVSIIADALEVGGSVAVNGQIPIFGTVAVNGNVPTDGAATVSYNCGGKQVPVAV